MSGALTKGKAKPHPGPPDSDWRPPPETPTNGATATNANVDPMPTFSLIAVRDIPEIVTQDWLVEGVIPRFPSEGAAGYIFGPAKARKSLLLADLALSVATGTKVCGKFEVKHTGAVVGFFAEDPKGETSRRIHRMARARGVTVPGNLNLINTPAIAIDNPDDQARLMNTLQSVPDLALVWLDPMVRLHRVNDNRAEELGPIHTFLRVLARSCPNAVIVLAHHANKEGDSRGSTDYNAFGDFNIYCKKKDQLTTEITNIENRGGPPGKPFKFTVDDGHVDAGATMQLVAQEIEDVDEEEIANVKSVIAGFIADNPGLTYQETKRRLRKTGLSFGSDVFSQAWKDAKKGSNDEA